MPEQLAFTKLLNHLFAQPVTAVLTALHFPPKYADAPISNPTAMELLVFGFLLAAFLLVRSQLSIEKPGALQHVFEGIEGFVGDQSADVILLPDVGAAELTLRKLSAAAR
jgi:F-type H+-transporting ATPase subunit a